MKRTSYRIEINENATQNLINSDTDEIVLEAATSDEIDEYVDSRYFMFPSLLNRIRFFLFKK